MTHNIFIALELQKVKFVDDLLDMTSGSDTWWLIIHDQNQWQLGDSSPKLSTMHVSYSDM